jgi:hypothetical protein
MAATATDVSNYKYFIKRELSWWGNKLATKHQIGDKPSFDKEVKFMLLQSFVEIADWYLDEWDDPDNNGMTVDEFNDIQQHINRIANSFHWLEIE